MLNIDSPGGSGQLLTTLEKPIWGTMRLVIVPRRRVAKGNHESLKSTTFFQLHNCGLISANMGNDGGR